MTLRPSLCLTTRLQDEARGPRLSPLQRVVQTVDRHAEELGKREVQFVAVVLLKCGFADAQTGSYRVLLGARG